YLRAFQTVYPGTLTQDKQCLIIGAGGAARSIFVTLSKHGMRNIDIVNRTTRNAEKVAAAGEKHTTTNVISLDKVEKTLHKYDILIQTTTVGMKPLGNDTVFPVDNLKKGSIVSDIIYQPIHTTFLERAKQNGA